MKNDIPTSRSDRNIMRHHNTVASQALRREAAEVSQAERDKRTDQEQLDLLVANGHAKFVEDGTVLIGCKEAFRLHKRIQEAGK